jgi:hypothetical protein
MDLSARRTNSFSWWRKKVTPPAARPIKAISKESDRPNDAFYLLAKEISASS